MASNVFSWKDPDYVKEDLERKMCTLLKHKIYQGKHLYSRVPNNVLWLKTDHTEDMHDRINRALESFEDGAETVLVDYENGMELPDEEVLQTLGTHYDYVLVISVRR